MGVPPEIPTRYRTDKPAELRTDLERMAVGVIAWARALPSTTDSKPTVGKLTASGSTLGFGTIARVAPRDDQQIDLYLPRPDSTQGGRTLGIMRLTSGGAVQVIAPDSTVNGHAAIFLLGGAGLTTIAFDGADYFMSNGGSLPWDAGL